MILIKEGLKKKKVLETKHIIILLGVVFCGFIAYLLWQKYKKPLEEVDIYNQNQSNVEEESFDNGFDDFQEVDKTNLYENIIELLTSGEKRAYESIIYLLNDKSSICINCYDNQQNKVFIVFLLICVNGVYFNKTIKFKEKENITSKYFNVTQSKILTTQIKQIFNAITVEQCSSNNHTGKYYCSFLTILKHGTKTKSDTNYTFILPNVGTIIVYKELVKDVQSNKKNECTIKEYIVDHNNKKLERPALFFHILRDNDTYSDGGGHRTFHIHRNIMEQIIKTLNENCRFNNI